MYFTKAKLDIKKFYENEYHKYGKKEYLVHQLIWLLFPNEEERNFIYREDRKKRKTIFYVISENKPQPVSFLECQTKEYVPKLEENQELSFSIRANPVVKKYGKYHDVIMDKKKQLKEENKWNTNFITQNILVQQEGVAWLKSKAKRYGFELIENTTFADSYIKREFKKPKNGRKVTFVTVDFVGRLRITDIEKFKKAMFKGLGRTKAFGCGLMLLKRT